MSQPTPSTSPGGTPAYRELLTSSLLMGLGGWALIAALVFLVTPTLGPRWAFFFALFIALVGTKDKKALAADEVTVRKDYGLMSPSIINALG